MKDRLLRRRRPLITSPLEWQMTAAPVSHPVIPVLAERGGTQLQAPRPTLLVDTREQNPFNFSRFKGWFAGVEKKALRLGDYSIAGLEDICVVERKDLADLLHSCRVERTAFIKRLRLMARYPHRLLVITSTLSQTKSPYALSFAKILPAFDFNRMRRCRPQGKWDTTSGMIDAMGLLFGAILRLFRARRSLLLENLALRQQLAALKHRHPRPRLAAFDKVFWVLAREFWSGWKQALIVVSPETVVRWHRSGFALYWRAISKAHRVVGRRRISKEVRDLIFRMVAENPTWGAPRIHGMSS